jgi:uncharacterized membrane protein
LLRVDELAAGHRIYHVVRGCALNTAPRDGSARLQYLDALRGLAVVAMVLAHVTDSWTRAADRQGEPYYTLLFIGGIASPAFLFLAGVASAMSAASKARRDGSLRAGAAAARRRGWEIFALGLVFRVQAEILGLGPLSNLLKVDMLNTMGLSIVAATWLWQTSARRPIRVSVFALSTMAVAVMTPLVRATPSLAALPDPLEGYLRPAGTYAAFPLFPWAGFLFAGLLAGDLVDAVRMNPRRQPLLQAGMAVCALGGAWLAWRASFQPAVFPTASFWHDSPTFFFIRLGLVTATLPAAWLAEQAIPSNVFAPMVTLGRSSLFVYWIHVEMVYGVIAGPLKQALPVWGSLAGTFLLVLVLYLLVLIKNRWVEEHGLPGRLRILAPVVR